jgi:serine/threonine-protein kinase
MIGTTLGRYRILGALGQGGMGQVYLAEDPTLARKVAIKVLPPEFSADGERRSRLLHEARAASALNHPNILTVHDLGDEGGTMYVAMELIEGQTLREWAGARARTPGEILALMRQATRALGAAHAAGLVHRDLKPENLMVRGDGLLKVLDFGLARSVSPDRDGATMAQTMPGTILGTAPYMSPEQVLGQPAGPASDVFSMGTLIYELLTGKHPFAVGTPVDTMHRILHEMPPAPSTLREGLPPALDFVLAKAMAKDPARRYANARDLDVDLETCEASLAPKPAPAPAASPLAGGGAKAGGPRSIAVLPFKNIGGNADLNYLGVGLADAVITRLSSSPDLIVRATSSIARYESQSVDPMHVARELDVSAVLDASFQRAGERFRATARLVEAPGGQALWAGKIDLRLEDIFEVQDEVANGIATALTARLQSKSFTPSAEAYDLFLRSSNAVRAGRQSAYQEGMAMLERAVELEPRYADAWAMLGSLRHTMADSGIDPDQRWYARAEEAERRALEIEPGHVLARFYLGALELVRGHKREAYRMFTEAYRKAPNEFGLAHYLAYVYRLCNMWDEFFAAEQRALELDPSMPWPYWAMRRVHADSGRIEESRRWLERLQSRFPGHPRTPLIVSAQLRAEGRYEESIEILRGLNGSSQSGISEQTGLASSLIAAGQLEEARGMVGGLAAAADADMDMAMWVASMHAQLGNPDEAFRFLGRATELGNDQLDMYEDPRWFAPLFDDPRWGTFIEGVRARVAEYKREFRWPPV